MGFRSKAISTELANKLASLSYAPYQSYCRELLSEIFTETAATKEMKKLDSAGVDLFLLNDDFNKIKYGFQCKGFEVSHVKEDQIKQCLHSIKSLTKLKTEVENYFLIINRVLTKEEIITLKIELEEVKKAKLIGSYTILDLNSFIEFLYRQIRKNFSTAIRQSNYKLFQQYKDKLDQRFYYTDVPFELNEHTVKTNPSLHLSNGFSYKTKPGNENDPAHFALSKYFFVIGDFGFGKTSLLFQSMADLPDFSALYIPFSFFKKRDFQTKMDFTLVIYSLILGEEVERADIFSRFKAKVLWAILFSNPQLILLFDGMDENQYLGTTEGLKQLFRITNDIKSKCVFSLRKSFWEERQGNFQVALPKGRVNKDRLKLLEWDTKQILEYTDLFQTHHELTETQRNNVKEFTDIIRKNRYQNLYGDIPKRPLFLEMIIQDVIEGNIKEILLSELYEKYFFRKFVWDNESNFDEIPQGRPITYEGDVYKGFSEMCNIMEAVAGSMLVDEGSRNYILDATINEITIEPILQKSKIESLNALLLNSVLTTTASRTLQGIEVQFAHKSFQEYFTARYLYNFLFGDYEIAKNHLSAYYPDTVTSFLINCIEWKDKTSNILKHPNFRKIVEENWLENSLGDLIRIPFKKKILE